MDLLDDCNNQSADRADQIDKQLRLDIVNCGKSLYQNGFIAGSEGNISLRISEGLMLITPAGARKGELQTTDIVKLDVVRLSSSGEQIPTDMGLRPSSEAGMHLAVYRNRRDIHACVHSHAPHATAFAVAGIEPEIDVLPEVSVFIGRIALTEYAPPGTPAVGESLKPLLTDCNAFLLKNHGLLTIGKNLAEALNRHEIVEQYLKILTLAKSLGNVNHLDPAEMQRLQKLTSG